MADLPDVETALLPVLNGLGVAYAVYRGWPEAAALDAALLAGQTHVTVWPDGGMYRVTAITEAQEWVQSQPDPTLTASMSGASATFSGACSTDQIAGIQAGTTAWGYRCLAGDTPANVAAALAAASGGTAAGPVVTLSGLTDARTGRDAIVLRASRQQEAGLRVIVWAPTPAARDLAAGAIDAALADLYRLAMPDGTSAIIRAGGTITTDRAQQSNLYRRDLRLRAEYKTTLSTVRTPVLWPGIIYQPGSLRFGALHP